MPELRKGIIYSIILHIAFIFLFYSINVRLDVKEPEFVEVSFAIPPPAYEEEEIKKGKIEKVELPKIQSPKEEKIYEPKEIVEPIEIEKYIPGVGEDVITEAYTITGEIATRRVIYKVIPKYPKGYNIETKVSVRVFVSPDGSINKLQLIKKGGIPFDEITKDALMEWKFAPLPKELPQVVQQGIITFIYKLK